MKRIQWFPGHMAKAMRGMEESVKAVDAVIIVLDARAPISCINPKLDELFKNKPVLYAVNKSDLVDRAELNKVNEFFIKDNKPVVCITGTDKKAVNLLYTKIFELLKDKVDRNKLKGVFKPMHVMVAGVPNTGKSTIINTLVGAKRAVTGDKAGVTKNKQWVRLNELELLDTPGTMPPYFENQIVAKRLAYIGSINDDILDFEDLALELLSDLMTLYPNTLKEKYGVEVLDKTPLLVYEEICKRRGFLLRGGDYDYERGAKAIIDDFRKGRTGKILLDIVSPY